MKKHAILCLALFAAALAVAAPAAAEEAPAAAVAAPAPADCAAPTAEAAPAGDEPLFLAGEICGSKICGKGTYCCNASCSLCVRFDMSCTQQVCAQAAVEEEPDAVTHFLGGQPCNQAVCGPNEFCCNHSCSICAPRGGFCTQQVCPPTS